VPFDVQRARTELVWKPDISFGDKALGLKPMVADVIHYCHLGKMDVPREINNLTLFYFLELPSETGQFPHIRLAEIHNGN